MSCFLVQYLDPGSAPGPVWTQKTRLGSRNELLLNTEPGPLAVLLALCGLEKKLFSSRNELFFLLQTWTLAPGCLVWAPV